jgi:dCTP diphosphatase
MIKQNETKSKALTIAEVQKILRDFVVERSWEKFHTPKNLVLALIGEVGELAEHFQWLSDSEALKAKEDPDWRKKVGYEIADVCSYLFRLADVLQIDMDQVIREKILINGQKYPVELSRGSAVKYDKLK